MAYVFEFNVFKKKMKVPEGYDLYELQQESWGRPTIAIIKNNELVAKKTLLTQDMENYDIIQNWINGET